MSDDPYLKFAGDRVSSRQIDELVGLARGLVADGKVTQEEVEYLRSWLAASVDVAAEPLIAKLFRRVNEILADRIVDAEEASELFDTLKAFTGKDIALGESLRATTLPLCDPAPTLTFVGQRYCFTGSFLYGRRRECEAAVESRGAKTGGIAQSTTVMVIGTYATDSWKHSAFGNKILLACEFREKGLPISIVSEDHWVKSL